MDDKKVIQILSNDEPQPEGTAPEQPRSHKALEQMMLPLKYYMRHMEIDGKVAESALNMIIKGMAILGADAAMVNHVINDLAREISAVEKLAD